MSEFSAWVTKFKAYFKASNMHLLGVEEQQAYVYSRMGPQLTLRMEGTVSPSVGLSAFLDVLKGVFLQIHLLFQRRMSWFQLEKGKETSFMHAYHNIMRQLDEAEMDNMTREDWIMFRLCLSP